MQVLNYNGEEWRRIKEADNFLVSNLGRVKSEARLIRYEHNKTGEEFYRQTKDVILKGTKNKHGYPFVIIRSNEGNKMHVLVHRLVAQAFIPNPDNHPFVNHKDGIKSNNRVENLEWCTPKYNSEHSVKIGANRFGSNSPISKLDENLVELLKIKMALGYTPAELSYEYNIDHVSLLNIKKGKSWKHVVIPDGIKPIRKGNTSHKIPIFQVNGNGVVVRKYPSINAASKALGLKYWDIQRRLRNPLSHNEDGLNFTFINNN